MNSDDQSQSTTDEATPSTPPELGGVAGSAPCPKCSGEMKMTPVCLNCGTIPIAELDFQKMRRQRDELQEIVNEFVRTYWTEVHMGGLFYKAAITPELLERTRAAYSPQNDEAQQRREERPKS